MARDRTARSPSPGLQTPQRTTPSPERAWHRHREARSGAIAQKSEGRTSLFPHLVQIHCTSSPAPGKPFRSFSWRKSAHLCRPRGPKQPDHDREPHTPNHPHHPTTPRHRPKTPLLADLKVNCSPHSVGALAHAPAPHPVPSYRSIACKFRVYPRCRPDPKATQSGCDDGARLPPTTSFSPPTPGSQGPSALRLPRPPPRPLALWPFGHLAPPPRPPRARPPPRGPPTARTPPHTQSLGPQASGLRP
jgi:hypothetical protein